MHHSTRNEQSLLFSESVRGAKIDMFCGLIVGVVALCREGEGVREGV